MRLPVELEGEVIKIDLEYEKLEKHCFICYSLSHEKDTCPLNRDKPSTQALLQDISQQNTLRMLEDHPRKHDHRKTVYSTSRDKSFGSRDQQYYNQRSVYSRIPMSARDLPPYAERPRPPTQGMMIIGQMETIGEREIGYKIESSLPTKTFLQIRINHQSGEPPETDPHLFVIQRW